MSSLRDFPISLQNSASFQKNFNISPQIPRNFVTNIRKKPYQNNKLFFFFYQHQTPATRSHLLKCILISIHLTSLSCLLTAIFQTKSIKKWFASDCFDIREFGLWKLPCAVSKFGSSWYSHYCWYLASSFAALLFGTMHW